MDNFWKGMFVPLRKHVDSVKYIRFEDMKREDWLIYDYPNLRPAAKRDFQNKVTNCQCSGFYQANIDQHIGKVHGGKSTYYYVTSDTEGREFSEEQAHEEFGNFEGYDQEVNLDTDFEQDFSERLAKKMRILRVAIVAAVVKAYLNYLSQQQTATSEDPADAEEAEEEQEELEQEVEDKIEEYLVEKYRDWPKWAVVLLLLRYEKCGVPESVLNDIENL